MPDKTVKSGDLFPILPPEPPLRIHKRAKTLKRKPSEIVRVTVRMKLRDVMRIHAAAEKAGRTQNQHIIFVMLDSLKPVRK